LIPAAAAVQPPSSGALSSWAALFAFLVLRSLLARSPLAASRTAMNLLAVFSVAALLAAQFVLFTHFLDLPRSAPFWAGLPQGLFLLAAGAYGAWYSVRYRRNAELEEAALKLPGFAPADSGPARPDGKYSVKGRAAGTDVWLCATAVSQRRGPSRLDLEIACRADNPGGVRLAAYPEGVLNRPLRRLPPKSGPVPYWDWYTVRSEPPGAAEKYLPAAKKDGCRSVFGEPRGFRFLVLEADRLVCSFRIEGGLSKGLLSEIVDQTARLAASIR